MCGEAHVERPARPGRRWLKQQRSAAVECAGEVAAAAVARGENDRIERVARSAGRNQRSE